jgi:hypothetical protein
MRADTRKVLTASTRVAACELSDAVRLTAERHSIGLGAAALAGGDDLCVGVVE